MSDLCGTAAGKVAPKGRMSTGWEKHCKFLSYLTAARYVHMLCVCLGCCAAEFGSSGGTLNYLYISLRIHNPHGICLQGFWLHYKLWEKLGITGQGSYLYLCVWAKLRASCLFFFKRSFCNRARFEVKSKTVIKSHILLAFYGIKAGAA
jgi:hypothetical protein